MMSASENHAQQMKILLEIGRQVSSDGTLGEMLQRITSAATDLTDTESAGILLWNEQDNNLRFVAASFLEDQLLDIPVPLESSIAGACFSSGAPILIPDVSLEPRYYRKVEEETNFKGRSLLAVPLLHKQRKIGVLEVENKRDNTPFTPQDTEILAVLASHATVAIENMRLYHMAQKELSERTLAEQEIRCQRDHLEELVTERTARLAAALAESDLLINDLRSFSNMVAHDIKSPLSGIITATYLIEQYIAGGTPADALQANQRLQNAAFKINAIVDELLLLANLRQEDVPRYPIAMGKVIEEAERRLAKEITQAQAQITHPAQWPTTTGYSPWLEEVWVNYLSNALKYGGNPPRIELGAEPYIDPASGAAVVRFWVRDNGPGIPAAQQAQLFVAFERLEQKRISGYGLGLTVVKRIVEKLGGKVGVESTPGQGSKFYFILPI